MYIDQNETKRNRIVFNTGKSFLVELATGHFVDSVNPDNRKVQYESLDQLEFDRGAPITVPAEYHKQIEYTPYNPDIGNQDFDAIRGLLNEAEKAFVEWQDQCREVAEFLSQKPLGTALVGTNYLYFLAAGTLQVQPYGNPPTAFTQCIEGNGAENANFVKANTCKSVLM